MFSKVRLSALSTLVLLVGLSLVGLSWADDVIRPTTDKIQHYRAKELLGLRVNLEGNTAAGTIDDIVLDSYGNVDYVIVINDNRKLVTVPWDAVVVNPQQKQVVIHIAPDRFRSIPTYTPTQYPTFSTPTYRSEVYRYYGLTPGQNRRMFERQINR